MKNIVKIIIAMMAIIFYSNINVKASTENQILERSKVQNSEKMTFQEMIKKSKSGDLKSIRINHNYDIEIMDKNRKKYLIEKEIIPKPYSTWIMRLVDDDVELKIEMEEKQTQSTIATIVSDITDIGRQVLFGIILPLALLIILYFMIDFLKKMTIKPYEIIDRKNPHRTHFTDIAGAYEAKQEMTEIVEYLKDPERFENVGAKPPKGILLVGPPGNGKTLLAKAVATEADVPFFSVAGSAFSSKFVGVGSERIRKMFKTLRKKAPAILFIDELDAIGSIRSSNDDAASREANAILDQLLTELDGLSSNSRGITVIAATNRLNILDPALIRAGRFDRHIIVTPPDIDARTTILEIECRSRPMSNDIDLEKLARTLTGFSGADITTLINDAATEAARRRAKTIEWEDIERAKDRKLLGGAERHIPGMTTEELKTIAIHESGHAIVTALNPNADPVHKATIIARGQSLGHVASAPEGERVLVSRKKLDAELMVLMAGRAAESLMLKDEDITVGAAEDLKMATSIAYDMVTKYGLGKKMTTLRVDYDQTREISELTSREIDEEVENIVRNAFSNAKSLINSNLESYKAIVDGLLEKETLTGIEIDELIEMTKKGETDFKSAPPFTDH